MTTIHTALLNTLKAFLIKRIRQPGGVGMMPPVVSVALMAMTAVASAQETAPADRDGVAQKISDEEALTRASKAELVGNYAEAVKWIRLLAERGNVDAQYTLGDFYHSGKGVPQDFGEAAKWSRLAADQGDAGAQYNLGVIYEKGQGVVKNYVEAAKWYRLAAEQGFVRAQVNLGAFYGNGWGVSQNILEAYFWFDIAAVGGDIRARNFRDIAARLMTPDDISKARRRSREWFAGHKKD